MPQGSKHDPLTEAEMAGFHLKSRVIGCLDDCAGRLGVPRDTLRVLDWGCGRGRTVLKLLEMGIDAYGVDIDPGPIKNGIPIMEARGLDPQKRLICIGPDLQTPFPDDFFHVVLSEQVFEHVSDLEALAAELFRITTPGGAGLHVFPAKWRVTESHLHIPYVHWLPKNRLRYWYLYLMVNRIPPWRGMEGMSASDRAEVYYRYSVEKTYYRSLKKLRKTLNHNGFDVDIQTGKTPMRKLNVSSKFRAWRAANFNSVELKTVRR